jgi:CheY-like chemotaxis protein
MLRNVLLIDDDKDFRDYTRAVFEGEGWTVSEMPGSDGVMEVLKSKKFDLVITDLMMENHDSGFALAYKIKKEFPELPVYMATSMVKQTGLSFGKSSSWIKADRILHKPVSVKALIDIISSFDENNSHH